MFNAKDRKHPDLFVCPETKFFPFCPYYHPHHHHASDLSPVFCQNFYPFLYVDGEEYQITVAMSTVAVSDVFPSNWELKCSR